MGVKYMEYYTGRDNIKLNNTAVTIGKFDGLHTGHQSLINKIKNNEEGLQSVLFTFEQDLEREYIYSEEEKKDIARELGVDIMIVYPFDDETKYMDAEKFVKNVLINSLGARKIVIGSDFRFGKDRIGDANLLEKLTKTFGYELIVCNKKRTSDNKEISSTLIRNYILDANIDMVTQCLGRFMSISGTVIKGRQIGRTIGFPTINVVPDKCKLLPPNGVYISDVSIINKKNGKEMIYKGLTNIGNKPTIASDLEKNVETYICDFNEEIYGEEVKVFLKKFIRPEVRFSGVEELKQRLELDKNIMLNEV